MFKGFTFYMGSHHVSQKWWDLGVPLFISQRSLRDRRGLPEPMGNWALDSGGFTELSMFGEWTMSEEIYISHVKRFENEMRFLDWVAPQDWMCEPQILAKTGLTIEDHRRKTVLNFIRLRQELGEIVIPVLQGWERDDYLRCWELYERCGVDLKDEKTVGLGTVCRRQNTKEAEEIVRALPLRLHGFGVKMTGLAAFSDALVSADSLAWSYNGRKSGPCPSGRRKNCANCIHHALGWRDRVLTKIRLEEAA